MDGGGGGAGPTGLGSPVLVLDMIASEREWVVDGQCGGDVGRGLVEQGDARRVMVGRTQVGANELGGRGRRGAGG